MNTPLQELIEMKNIPDKLYLQIGLEDNGEECEDFNELDTENITWSTGKVFNDDIEYTKSSRTEEIAIGVSHYAEKEGFDYSLAHKIWIGVDNVTKTDKELYQEYMKTI